MRYSVILIYFLFSAVSYAQVGLSTNQQITDDLKGIWENNVSGEERILKLNEGGIGEYDGAELSYKVSGNQLSITVAGISSAYNFSLSNHRLILSGAGLVAPIKFFRKKPGSPAENAREGSLVPMQSAQNSLSGKWEGNNEVLEFRDDGIIIIQGISRSYSLAGNNLTIMGPNGTQTFPFHLESGFLTIDYNGQSQVYHRQGAAERPDHSGNQQTSGTPSGSITGKGIIARELVGKWCYVNVSAAQSGGVTSDECIVINGDGTYEYNFESSGSSTSADQYGNQAFSSGTASEGTDRGTWRLDGSTLYVQSQSRGALSFTLEKMNHPQNGDPMIVIDGRTFVSYYPRPGW